MALIKNNDYLLVINRMLFIFLDKSWQFLDRRNNDMRLPITELLCKNWSRGVTIGGTFLKPVIFLHCLVIKIFSIYDEQDFINVRKLWSEPCCFKWGQSFTRSCGMPNISASCYGAILLIIMSDLYSIQYSFCCRDLIRTHNHQHIFRCENTILCQDIQNRMLCKKGFRKVNQIRDYFIAGIRPEGSKFKAIACLFLLCLSRVCIFNCVPPSAVWIVLCIRSIGDHKNLNILK